jgi:hypothetical protein
LENYKDLLSEMKRIGCQKTVKMCEKITTEVNVNTVLLEIVFALIACLRVFSSANFRN